jgi:probable rRNA maturation factor
MNNFNCNVDVFVEEDQWIKTLPLCEDLCSKAIKASFEYKDLIKESFHVNIILANNEYLQKLNREFRGQNKPTNVLSFPSETDYTDDDENMLGDIFLAIETIKEEASFDSKSFEDHLQHLVIHGFLHLLSYDHEIDSDAKIMEDLEIKILESMGIKNPYLEIHDKEGLSLND